MSSRQLVPKAPGVDGICHCQSFNPPNPSLRADDEIQDCPLRARVTIRQLVRASTTFSRRLGRIDNDRVAPGCNEVAHPGTDCLRGVIRCPDRYAEVSKQNVVSTDIRRVYSFHFVSPVMTGSSVPSKMISSRSRPTVPNAPYVFTRSSGS